MRILALCSLAIQELTIVIKTCLNYKGDIQIHKLGSQSKLKLKIKVKLNMALFPHH